MKTASSQLLLKLLAPLLVMGVAGCAKISRQPAAQENAERPPSGMSYSQNPARYPYGSVISANELTSENSIDSLSISPDLPDGLSFNTTNGRITGLPKTITGERDYIVTAHNKFGSDYITLTLEITDLPPTMSFAGPFTKIFNVGTAIATITPTLAGGATTGCSSSPSLPPGLSLSSQCVISGTPTSPAAATNYVITASNRGGSASLTFNFTVKDRAPVVSYPVSPYNATRGLVMTNISPTSTGGTPTSCTAAPALPTGITLSSTCILSGTPTVTSAPTTYTITATNSGGTVTPTFVLSVTDIVPNLTYAGSPLTYKVGTAISTLTPTNTGGIIDSCSIMPALSAGLSFNTSTCAISGTPTAALGSTAYSVTATNTAGSNVSTVTISVNDIAPNFSYPSSPYTFNRFAPIAAVTPTSTGGTITSCTSSPPLPTGLMLTSGCGITGTPTVVQSATVYTLTGTNSGGSKTATLSIKVNEVAPNISYTGTPFTFTKGITITTQNATNDGGSIANCDVSPALPTGLVLNSSTCAITGTPSVIAATANYTVTATNAVGSSSSTISVTVNDTLPVISYPTSPFVLTKNLAMTTTAVTNTGGAIVSCAISPALPAGLSLNTSNCTLSGTPTAISAVNTYTVTATNSAGDAVATFDLRVNDIAPNISYSGSPLTYTKNVLITPKSATNSGGTITGCTSTPALPAGLSIANATCQITGTPSAITAAANYVITATNTGGSSSYTLNITINDAAPIVSYADTPFTFTKNSAITPATITNTGGTITSCSSSPALPAGLTLSPTCGLSGTPTAFTATATYTIAATNSGGTGTTTISITVNDIAPSFSFAGSPFTFVKGVEITPLSPTYTGGAVTSCSPSVPLPAGLSLSSTCILSGTPTALKAATDYTFSGTNSGGTGTDTINITVIDVVPVISYLSAPFILTNGSAMTTAAVTNTGGAIVSCAIDTPLPAGLTFNTSTCSVSGTPTAISSVATYTVTATNSAGTGVTSFDLTVLAVAPHISYVGTTVAYTKDVAISAKSATNSGGAITGCTSSPALPSGLSIDNTTCEITGTPDTLSAAANYVITATNSGGSSSVTLNIAINDAAPAIAYAGAPFTFTKNSAIANQTPTNGGGVITSCASSPALPSGLLLSNGCVLSGTPSAISAATNYSITATNSGGTSTAVVSITVNDVVPAISYAGSPFTFTVGSALVATAPVNTGGAITSCTSTPALPTGLSLSSACVISGTPSAPVGAAVYNISATNSGGSGSANINIAVNDAAPNISYSGSPFTFTKDSPITAQTPINTGGTPTSCSAAPALPAGLSLSSACVISGTPSITSGATAYVITATNATGTGTANITITVNNTAPSISYPSSTQTMRLRSPMSTMTPTSTGGSITSCTSDPALPAGLSINNTTCVISGTPTATSGTTSYAITATNAMGSSTANISLQVKDQLQIVFYSKTALSGAANGAAPGSYNLWKVSADGMDRTALTSNAAAGSDSTYPSFKSSGAKIVFASLASASSYNVWNVDSDGSSATGLTANTNAALDADLAPRFSADGTKIVFASLAAVNGANNGAASGSYNIFIMNSNGTGLTALTTNTNSGLDSIHPVFSPDGNKIYFQSKTALNGAMNGTATDSFNIWQMNVNGSGLTALTTESSANLDSITPSVSPDGTQIVFASKKDIGFTTSSSYNIWKINSNGTGLTSLTQQTAINKDSADPTYSNSGTQIAFRSKMNIGASTANSFNIWTMSSSGASQTAITQNTAALRDSYAPQFSPDDSKLIFYSKQNVGITTPSSYNIWITPSDGTGSPTSLTTNTNAGLDSYLSPGTVSFQE